MSILFYSPIPTREVGMETASLNRVHDAISNKSSPNTLSRENIPDVQVTQETTPDTDKQQDPVINTFQESEIAQKVNNFLKSIQTDIKVEIHKETHRTIFKIIRKDDQKVIREIPPREMLEIEAKIEKMIGSFLDTNA
jgi:flagellar protein FlaG